MNFFKMTFLVLKEIFSPYILMHVGIILVVIYVFFCAYLYIRQDSLIFFPTKEEQIIEDPNLERIYYEKDDIRLSGFIRKGAGPTFFYFGGNASEAYKSLKKMKITGTILSFNYRGYGKSSGTPSEKNFFSDAIALYDWLEKEKYLKQKDTILFGKSLGTGVASYLSSERPSRAIILETPYDSLANVAQGKYPIFPVKLLLRHHFNSLKYLSSYQNPILLIYAGQDKVIPNKYTKNLISHLHKDRELLFVEKATHDDIIDFKIVTETLDNFSKKVSQN